LGKLTIVAWKKCLGKIPNTKFLFRIYLQRRFLFSSKSESPEQEKKEETEEIKSLCLRKQLKLKTIEDSDYSLNQIVGLLLCKDM